VSEQVNVAVESAKPCAVKSPCTARGQGLKCAERARCSARGAIGGLSAID